jgi:hypothetical protein
MYLLQSTRLALMTQEETDKMFHHATTCVEGECNVDEVDALIDELKAQQKELSSRLNSVNEMIIKLGAQNTQEERKTDEVRDTVRAIFRVFQLGDKASGNDYPALKRATGWTGDVGGGPTTAYDALPPKKWKKTE